MNRNSRTTAVSGLFRLVELIHIFLKYNEPSRKMHLDGFLAFAPDDSPDKAMLHHAGDR